MQDAGPAAEALMGPPPAAEALGYFVYWHEPSKRLLKAIETCAKSSSEQVHLYGMSGEKEDCIGYLPRKELTLLASADGYLTSYGRDFLAKDRTGELTELLLSLRCDG